MRSCFLLFLLTFVGNYSCYATDNKNLSFKEKSHSNFLVNFGSNALSGSLAMTLYSPFHYLQNRVIQDAPIAKEVRFWFKGSPALIFGKAPTIAVKISCYELLMNLVRDENNKPSNNSKVKIAAATVAGGFSGIINNFTHLIALHQENQRTPFKETTQQLSKVPRDLIFRGLGTTVSREMIFTNIYLVFLKDMKNIIQQKADNKQFAFICSALCSGAIIAGATQPLMVISTKLYADMDKKEYKNGLDVACKTYHKGGIKAFYKGSGWRSMGIVAAIATLDTVEEKLASFFNKEK